jgi:RNA polymerase sigma-70 factor (ECF subfamily)
VKHDPEDLHELLARARRGEHEAFDQLFRRYSDALRQAIRLRFDRRLQARLDVSDVLQETYLEAVRRLPDYLKRPDMPFGLWLRWLARDRLLELHRRHLGTDMRAVQRELPLLPADSSAQLLHTLGGKGPTPSQALAALEAAERLRTALAVLSEDEREVILLRHFECLSNREIAWLLSLSESAAHKRYIRALQRLRGLLLNLDLS